MAKFCYEWQGADRVRRRGEIEAPNRDAAFAALRAQGVRAIRVEPKDGGRGGVGRGFSARAVAGIVLGAAAIAAVIGYWAAAQRGAGGGATEMAAATGAGVPAKAMPRRQVAGIAEVAVDTVFARPSERFLARFAQPGETNSFVALTADVEDDFFDALDSPVLVRATDARAAADLKRIVAGLKEEVRMLVHAGWTVRDIAERFKERARMEADYRARAIGAVLEAWREDPSAAERKMAEHNGWLRAMGIAEISTDELRAARANDQS